MTPPGAARAAAEDQHLSGRIGAARAALLWERAWRASWPASGFAGLFAAASLADLWRLVPGLVHGAALAATLGLVALCLWRERRALGWPSDREALSRIEASSGLAHRPLHALADRLGAGAGEAASEALWAAHRRRAGALLVGLRPVWPAPGLARKDPRALRFPVLLALLFGAALAGPEAPERLLAGLSPSFSGSAAGSRLALDAWIDPPDYTGAPPVFLARGALEAGEPRPAVSYPAGAPLLGRLAGSDRGAQVRFTPAEKGTPRASTALAPEGDKVLTGTLAVPASGRIDVRQGGRRLARWAVTVLPDRPPVITFSEAISVTPQSSLRLGYRTEDDFGVTAVEMRARRTAETPGGEDGAVLTLPLPAPGPGKASAALRAYKDLTAHPWAGETVLLALRAHDAAGQAGESEAVSVALPERPFSEPLAKALIDVRKRLIRDPQGATFAERFLGAATAAPEGHLSDLGVYLALRAAYWRLTQHRATAGEEELIALLWDTAVSIEEGAASQAERALEAAKEALADALRAGAPDDEIERLVERLREALSRYLDAVAERMASGEPRGPRDPSAQAVTPEDFAALLNAIGELSRMGARGEAQQLLSALDDILENLDTSGGVAEEDDDHDPAQEALQALGGLIGNQRNLMDESFRAAQPPAGRSGQGAPLDDLASRQETLRRALGDILSGLGSLDMALPEALGEAERAMQAARDKLQEGRGRRAVEHQKQALGALREGAQDLARALERQMSAGGGPSGSARGGAGQTDPFGRPLGAAPDLGSSVKVPDAGEMRRAREILDEIRRRAAERGRPSEELDYLRRLLDRF